MKRCLRFSIGTLLILIAIVAAFVGGYRAGYTGDFSSERDCNEEGVY